MNLPPDLRGRLLDELPAPVVVTDSQDKVLYVNRAFLSMLGCTEDFPIGKAVSSFLAPQMKLDSDTENMQPGGGGESGARDGDLMLLGADGVILPVHRESRVTDWDGKKITVSLLSDMGPQRTVGDHTLRVAYYDSLTGLPNRDYFLDSLNHEIRRHASAEGYSFSVMLLDMDRFRLLNEQYGSDVADKVFLEVIERTKSILTGFASIFRTGGDELAAILKGVSSQAYLESILERLQKLISIPMWINGDSVFPSACVTAMLDVPREFTALQTLGRLSGAMRVAKRRGAGCVLFAPTVVEASEPQAEQKDAQKIAAEIQTSLLNANFIPYFQPVYNTDTMQLSGFETLARWKHPENGILPPSSFLTEAEESGLVTAIDKTIVSQSLAAMEKFTRQHPNLSFVLGANASGSSLRDSSFFSFMEDELRRVTFPRERFALEVTADILLENLGVARDCVEKLKKLGIRVALDDFGTGYSSLQYIGSLAIDSLKIDRSFIGQLLKSKKTMGLVKSIIEMAQKQGLNVVAEGIETKEQNQWLAEYKVDGQGFFFSTPLSMEETEDFLMDAAAFAELK